MVKWKNFLRLIKRNLSAEKEPVKPGKGLSKREEVGGEDGGGEEYSDSVNEDLYLGPEKV